jgi:hemin uptake protein HemP
VEKFSFSGKDLGPIFPQGGRGPSIGLIFNSKGDLYACIPGPDLIATISPEGKPGEPFATGAAGPTVIVEHSTGTTFVTRPKGGQLEAGGNATFTIKTNRADVSYQWLKDGVALSDGGRVRGANSPSLRITQVTGADSGIYRVRITREHAAPSSAATTLMVMAAPTTMDTYLVSYPGCRRIEVFSMDGADLGAFVTTRVYGPQSMALDRQGNLFAGLGPNVEKFSPEGKDLGVLITKGPFGPQKMAIDDEGDIYVSNTTRQMVEKFSPTGKDLGAFVHTAKNQVMRLGPTALTIDHDGDLYVCDQADQTVKEFSPAGKLLKVFACKKVGDPTGLAVDGGGNVYVGNFENGIVEKLSAAGEDQGVYVQSETHFQFGLYVDGLGNLYICDGFRHNRNVILKYSPEGHDLGVFATTGINGPAQMILRPGSQ